MSFDWYHILLQTGNMAREGLRTLVVAKKTLTEDQYSDFEVSNDSMYKITFRRVRIASKSLHILSSDHIFDTLLH